MCYQPVSHLSFFTHSDLGYWGQYYLINPSKSWALWALTSVSWKLQQSLSLLMTLSSRSTISRLRKYFVADFCFSRGRVSCRTFSVLQLSWKRLFHCRRRRRCCRSCCCRCYYCWRFIVIVVAAAVAVAVVIVVVAVVVVVIIIVIVQVLIVAVSVLSMAATVLLGELRILNW